MSFTLFFRIVTLLMIFSFNHAVELESLYMKTSKLDDQATSGSQFSYVDVPSSLYQSNNDAVAASSSHEPLLVESYGKDLPSITYVTEDELKYAPYSIVDYYKGLQNPYGITYGEGNGYLTKFIDDKGNIYSLDNKAHYGYDDSKGYDSTRDFEKKLKGNYYNVDDKSYYNEKGGKNGLALQNDGHYASQHGYGVAHHGGSFSQKNGHDKGSKISGYQKVYRKDDYNKQHKFYDIADKRGHYKKYGSRHAKDGSNSGYFVHDNNKESQYVDKNAGAKGISDKGYVDEYMDKFKAAKGSDNFAKEYSKYDKENGSENKAIYDTSVYT
ncbi:uncharacterized protein LOC143190487 [Rhynchophorus ferrugineus]|uniref:Uncharacterized protein n=1 Tax=Rhynchophorus ferrugineus TaxID=354439 RepID=A0A834IBJ6_RHYFE|nr:hypothetical protein GWI33_008777 [Rhynchophorus ferrugineus]